MTKLTRESIVALFVLAASSATALGLVNPNFTLIDLTRKADVILLLAPKAPDKKGKVVATVKKVLKGKFAKKEIPIDMTAMPEAFQAQGREAMGIIKKGQKQMLLYIGSFELEGMEESEDEEPIGLLHMSGRWNAQTQWWVLEQYEGVWEMAQQNSWLLGTFAGSTDMALRGVEYALSDKNADMPVTDGVEWDKKIRVGKFAGKFRNARPVSIADRRTDIFLPGATGDRVLRYNGKTVEDIASKLKLTTKSTQAAWGDFNDDGRLDLASWDGKALTLCLQGADGTFKAVVCKIGDALKNGCLGMTTLGLGPKGRTTLLVSTKAWPVLLTVNADGSVKARPLVTKGEKAPSKKLGPASECLVADFDGDGLTDVLQLFAGGSLLHKGKAGGEFAAPAATRIMAGDGRVAACVGDYDADGLLDVFISSADGNSLWHNFGKGEFVDMLNVSGEISYHARGGGSSAATGDFNNDGRQDVLIAFSTVGPQLFFNRGFRSFGEAYGTNLDDKRLPRVSRGQQTGCLGDFTGDGALDMFLMLTDGECWLLPRKVAKAPALAVTAFLPAGGHAGPAMVTAWFGKRPMGAFAVRPGDGGAFFGLSKPGEVTLKWRLPGGRLQQKKIVVKKTPVRILLSVDGR